jgi:hypothetical protein
MSILDPLTEDEKAVMRLLAHGDVARAALALDAAAAIREAYRRGLNDGVKDERARCVKECLDFADKQDDAHNATYRWAAEKIRLLAKLLVE